MHFLYASYCLGLSQKPRQYPGCLEVALHLIDAMMEQGFDVAHSKYLREGQAITHAITCVYARIIAHYIGAEDCSMGLCTSPVYHASGAWRKSVSNAFRQIACKNNAFPRAKLARHLRCAALVLRPGAAHG